MEVRAENVVKFDVNIRGDKSTNLNFSKMPILSFKITSFKSAKFGSHRIKNTTTHATNAAMPTYFFLENTFLSPEKIAIKTELIFIVLMDL